MQKKKKEKKERRKKKEKIRTKKLTLSQEGPPTMNNDK